MKNSKLTVSHFLGSSQKSPTGLKSSLKKSKTQNYEVKKVNKNVKKKVIKYSLKAFDSLKAQKDQKSRRFQMRSVEVVIKPKKKETFKKWPTWNSKNKKAQSNYFSI